MSPDAADIVRAMTPPVPSLEQHDEIVACCERRFLRADEKLTAAGAEHHAAHCALHAARAARTQFVADNPDPQLSILDAIANS